MKILDTSPITNTVGMPVKGGTLQFLQLSVQEVLSSIAQNVVGPTYQTNIAYVLYGCVNSGSGLNYDISAGAIFYNGEVFLVPAITFTAAGGQVAVGSISTTQYTTEADPVQFTDGVNRNVHNIRQITFASGVSGTTIFDFSACRQTSITLVNDQEATLGSSYTVKFDQDKAIFFNSATVNTTIGFDFTNAIPGAVVRLKWTWGSSLTLTVTAGSGNVAYQEGGDITRAASHTNTMYFTYLGLNESGNHEVGYSISQVV